MLTPSLSLSCPPSLLPPGHLLARTIQAQPGLGYNLSDLSDLINLQNAHSHSPASQHFSFPLL